MPGPLNAYIDPNLILSDAVSGPLAGKSFAAKDLFDIAGHVSTCGNPDWARTHDAASAHAPSVASVLAAGATLRGKTTTDEFAFSIVGENHHFGTPENVHAPGRVCGGSSSGSAAAVAGGHVDFALGTDTGGSVRIPASFCGIFGLRPTHGRISLGGVFPLAPSFDTVGWFARDPTVLASVGEVLLAAKVPEDPGPISLIYPEDVWQAVPVDVARALEPGLRTLEAHFGPAQRVRLTGKEDLDSWFDTFRHAQGAEIWRTLGPWIEDAQPNIGPGIRERLTWCRSISSVQANRAGAQRETVTARLKAVVPSEKTVAVLPIAPGPALQTGQSAASSDALRATIIKLSGIAPLAGVPQLSLPVAQLDGMPLALSIMTAKEGDETLLSIAKTLMTPTRQGLSEFR